MQFTSQVERTYRDLNDLITMCVTCRRVQRPGTDDWDSVPEWEDSPPREVTGGLCDPCYQRMCARYQPIQEESSAPAYA